MKMRRCVTLGIPPTVRVAADRWRLSERVRDLAAEHVDGFVWFGRPWLYRQADPFVMKRALTMARTTPWPGPRR
jgi:endoglucanase